MTDNDRFDEIYSLFSKAIRCLRDWACVEENHTNMMVVVENTLNGEDCKKLYESISVARECLDKLAELGYCCRKGSSTCYCGVGWPYDRQCPDCRDTWEKGQFRDSYCICPYRGPIPEATETGKMLVRLEHGDLSGIIPTREIARGKALKIEPWKGLEAQVTERELRALEVIRGTAEEGHVNDRAEQGSQGDEGVQEPDSEVIERPEGDKPEAGHSHRVERGLGTGEGSEGEEEVPVKVRPGCSRCQNTAFMMKSTASDTPVPRGFLPMADRLLTCRVCGHQILYKDTYPVSMKTTYDGDVVKTKDLKPEDLGWKL